MTEQRHPIRRIGIPRIDAVACDLFNVRVTLATTPSPQWCEAFSRFENEVEGLNLTLGHLSVTGNTISLCGVREEDVEPWFQLIDTKIAGVNVQDAERTPATLTAIRQQDAAGALRQHEAQVRADRIARRWEAPDA